MTCLQSYGISLNQVLPITTYNDANVKKSVQLLRESQQEEYTADSYDFLMRDLNFEDSEFNVSERITNHVGDIHRVHKIDIDNIEDMPIDMSQNF